MNILFLSEYFPFPPNNGSKQRIWHTVKHLSRSHKLFFVTFQSEVIDAIALAEVSKYADVTLCSPPSIPRGRKTANFFSLTPLGVWRRHSPDFSHKVQKLLEKVDIDAIFLVELWLAQNILPIDDRLSVIDKHNLEFVRARRRLETVYQDVGYNFIIRWYYHIVYRRLKRYELRILQNFSVTLVCSDQDAHLLREEVESLQVHVMPNGVDLSYFHPQKGDNVEKSLVFTGTFSYEPNVDAAVYFVKEILPLIHDEYPEVVLYLVGSNPNPRVQALAKDERVVVTGYVDDVRPYVWRSEIVIVPLRMGSGTRLKVLEALAMAKPLVSTSIGYEGIRVVPGEHLQVADTALAFSEAVKRMLRNKNFAEQMGQSGRELVKQRYAWEKTLLILDELFSEK